MTIASSEVPTGMLCRVSSIVADGKAGEVVVSIRGGSEAFIARPAARGQFFHVGEEVRVVSFQVPRTVYVERP